MKTLITLSFLLSIFVSCNKEYSISTPNFRDDIPIVKTDSTYNVLLEDGLVYAQGLAHEDWNSENNYILNLTLDVYTPENSLRNRPAILLIHGGGLTGRTRKYENIVKMAYYFASRGWVAFSIDYRVRGHKGTVPEEWIKFNHDNPNVSQDDFLKIYPANRDAKAAIRWIYLMADKYRISTDHITVGGGSAGAYLSISLAITDTIDYRDELDILQDPTLATTNLHQPTKVHSIIDFWGAGSYVSILDTLYGFDRFDSSNPPILIVHGTADELVDFSFAEELKAIYESTGVDYEFHPLQGAAHTAWDATVNGKTLFELAFKFIVEQQNLIVE